MSQGNYHIQCLVANIKFYLVNTSIFKKYNVHVLIASFILLTHLSVQGKYTYEETIQCLAANIRFYLVNTSIFNEIQCSCVNSKFYLVKASV